MARVTYDPGPDGNKSTTVMGRTFEAGKSVDITDERQIEKLKGNPHFSVSGNAKAEKEQEATRTAAEEAAAAGVPPKGDMHPPMWPETHAKVEVQPTGAVVETEPDGDEDGTDPPRRGRPRKG